MKYERRLTTNSVATHKSRFRRGDFNLILSGIIFFIVLIGFLLNKTFIVNLKTHIEKEMVNLILTNSTIINTNINITSYIICRKILTNSSILRFRTNVDKYEKNREYSEMIIISNIIIASLLLIVVIILTKYNTEHIDNFIKKASIILAVIFTLIEYICLILYVSIYLKTFHMYSYSEDIIENNCFTQEMFADNFNENLVYEVFVFAFFPKLKFVYSSAIILMVLHFGNLIILLYKIKLLLILNLTNGNLNTNTYLNTCCTTYYEQYGKDNNYEMVVYNDNFANKQNIYYNAYSNNKYQENFIIKN